MTTEWIVSSFDALHKLIDMILLIVFFYHAISRLKSPLCPASDSEPPRQLSRVSRSPIECAPSAIGEITSRIPTLHTPHVLG